MNQAWNSHLKQKRDRDISWAYLNETTEYVKYTTDHHRELESLLELESNDTYYRKRREEKQQGTKGENRKNKISLIRKEPRR